PLPGGRSLVLLGFPTLEKALDATRQALPSGPASCDLLDRRLVTLVRGRDGDAAALVPAAAEAVLLVGYEADAPAGAAGAAGGRVRRVERPGPPPWSAFVAASPAEMDFLGGVREAVLPNLFGLRGGPQPVAGVEDVGVPPEELAHFLHEVQAVLQEHQTTASFLVHAGSGPVHIRPFLDLQRPGDAARGGAWAEEVPALALALGGRVSSQHGPGLARTRWVARQYGRLYPVLEELKAIFDPDRLFNPGKIVGPDPA